MWYFSLRCNPKESRFHYFSYVSFLLKYISFFNISSKLFIVCLLRSFFLMLHYFFSLPVGVDAYVCVFHYFSILHEILLTAIVCEFFFVLSKCTTFPGLKIARLFIFIFFICAELLNLAHTHTYKSLTFLVFAQPDSLALATFLLKIVLFYVLFNLPIFFFCFCFDFCTLRLTFRRLCNVFACLCSFCSRWTHGFSLSHSLAYVLVCN